MNEFSIVCRILGTLFYRQPQDPVVTPLLSLIQTGKLQPHWPLEQDALLARLQKGSDIPAIAEDYQRLFVGEACAVSPWRSAYDTADNAADVRTFLQQRGMPLNEGAVDHFGGLLLAASWLEDQSQEDESAAQIELFDEYLLPWSDRFLGKVESHAETAFYRTLAIICREALDAMREELDEAQALPDSNAE
ncbi:molecular chaperone [Brenneria sp. g21c3]|uniref:TorD/DmsD family molecular chaperone n=1 Tax=Brenneria sp. g21c3 TaxID=3093893 RepID=UPI002EA81084|nr:molecular chaperone [Brenneria sp. g21c3]